MGSWRISIGWIVAFALALFGIKLWLIGAYANATPFWDQWDSEAAFLYQPYLEGKLGWTDLFAPHNEHRILTTRLLGLALLELNGTWNPILQMVVNAALHVSVLLLMILLLVPALGHARLPAVLAFALLLFGVPYAWENTLSGFQAQFYFVLLFSVVCLWLAVLAAPLSPRWWAGVAFAVLAFLSLASGVFALAAAAGIGVVQYVLGMRRSRAQVIAAVILLLLFGIGVALTPSNPGHEVLKAGSLQQFVEALRAVLSWPFAPSFRAAALRNLPMLAFGAWLLWKRPTAEDVRWFLAALVLLALAQAVSIAYGRAVGSLASRYTDLFAIAVLVNVLCLVVLAGEFRGLWRGAIALLLCTGVAFLVYALITQIGKPLPHELETKRINGLAQEANVRNYLLTGDPGHISGKPHLHVPYPSTERLASILASPHLRAILPANIRAPMTPVSIDPKADAAFVPNGVFPATPKRAGLVLGSYGSDGDAAVGQVSIRFPGTRQGGLIAIPVAGYPTGQGIAIAIEQDGRRDALRVERDPKESWDVAHARVEEGPFSIVLTDRSTSTWVAIGAPTLAEGLAAEVEGLIGNWGIFLAIAFVLATATPLMQYGSAGGSGLASSSGRHRPADSGA